MDLKKESVGNENEQSKENDSIVKLVESWKASDWEQWLDQQEKPPKEILFDDPTSVENHSQEDQERFIRDTFEKQEYPALKNSLKEAVRSLTEKQQEVLHLLFWDNKSLKEISTQLSITTVAVGRIRDRALKKLGNDLLKQVTRCVHSLPNNVPVNETPVSKVLKNPIDREA